MKAVERAHVIGASGQSSVTIVCRLVVACDEKGACRRPSRLTGVDAEL
jgi:hypothetical protein